MKAKTPVLRPGEPAKDWVSRAATCLIETALQRTRARRRTTPETVHLLRVTAKRLRALLRLIRPVAGPAFFCRENGRLRKAARCLGAARDNVVVAKTLQSLGATTGLREWRKRSTTATLPPQSIRGVIEAFEWSQGWFQKVRLEGGDWAVIGRGLSHTFRSARRRMKAAMKNPDSESFHRWRIRVKHLYYQLQWLEYLRPKRFHDAIRDLHKLETLLGDDHDLAVLQQMLQTNPEQFGGETMADQVLKLASRRSRHLQRSALSCGECVFEESPRHFARELRRHLKQWRVEG